MEREGGGGGGGVVGGSYYVVSVVDITNISSNSAGCV